jgi:hypothetical protein
MHASYTQAIAAFCALTSKRLVNSGSNKVVNIASTEMMKRKFAYTNFSRVTKGAVSLSGKT